MKFINTKWQSFSANLAALYSMLDFIKTKAKKCNLSTEKIKKIELASEEAITNIIQHGKLDKDNLYILIKCIQKEDSLFEVLIKDKGIYFNPTTNRIDLQKTIPLENREPGGLGIFLMKDCVDEYYYKREGFYNILSLKIRNI